MLVTTLATLLRTLAEAGFFWFGFLALALLRRGCLLLAGLLRGVLLAAGLDAVAPLFPRLLEIGFSGFCPWFA